MSRYNTVEQILKTMPVIAVVGFSSQRNKAGYFVPAYMQRHGYTIIPVNPYIDSGLDKTAYASLHEVPQPVDIVQIFRWSQYVVPFVEEAVEIGAKAVWLQRDIVSERARQIAEDAGLLYVQDRCMMVEHRHLLQYGWRGMEAASAE